MTVRIDARGLRCPWPAIRLARALREQDGPIEIVADDPAASAELASVATSVGASIVQLTDEDLPTFRIQRGGVVNISFTRNR